MSKKKLEKLNFQSILTQIEETDDPRFSKGEVWVCHSGWNLNGSYMSRETIENAVNESIVGVPLVGFVRADVEDDKVDFAGHEEDIVINEEGVEYIYRGNPFGYVPESAEQRWETKDINGVEREYLITEVVIWNAFEGAKIVQRDGIKGQSMELHPEKLDYKWVEDLDGESGFEITNMMFDKLCALGDTVTPAMTGALIETFTKQFSVDGFMAKVREYESSQGGEIVKDKTKKVEKKVEEVEEVEVNNELSTSQKESMLESALTKDLGEVWVKYMSDSIVMFYHYDSGMYKQASYIINGEEVTVDMNSIEDSAVVVKPKSQVQDSDLVIQMTEHNEKIVEKANAKFEIELEHELAKEIDKLKESSKELNGELETKLQLISDLESKLDEYMTEEKVDLIESVENLTEDDVLELKTNVDEYSLNDLQDKIFNIIGRNTAKFSDAKKIKTHRKFHKVEEREKVEVEEEVSEKPDAVQRAMSALEELEKYEEE